MRYIKPLIILFCAGLFTSCIQEEPLNAEADILACHVDESILKKDPIIQNESIQLMVKSDTDISSQTRNLLLRPMQLLVLKVVRPVILANSGHTRLPLKMTNMKKI